MEKKVFLPKVTDQKNIFGSLIYRQKNRLDDIFSEKTENDAQKALKSNDKVGTQMKRTILQ